tara:strand:+ start:56 stop:1852 length:1797 start_codon:yes stop_codon:yes gene_type:complete
MAIKFLSDISLQKGQIKDVSLERLASDPTGTDAFEGRIYYNTGDDTVRYKTASAFVTLATGSGYSNWVLSASGLTGVDVDSGNTVDFAASTGLTVGRSSKTITYSLSEATSTVRGGIELFSDVDQAVAANSVSAVDTRTYGIQLNSDGQAVVNVPWTDTSTGSFTLTADAGTNQTIASGDTLDIAGGTGISTSVGATDTVTINLDDTLVSAGTYTSADITVDAQGRITSASSGGSGTMTSFTVAGDTGSDQTIENSNTLALNGATNGGIATVGADTDQVTFAMDVADLTATTTWTSASDYFAVSDGTATRKILSSNIPLNDFAAPDGDIAMGNNKITGLAAPTANADAATKLYVDNAVTGGLQFKGSFNATSGAISGGGGNLTSGVDRVAIEIGDLYIVSTAGNFFGNTATPLTIGDSVYCQTAAAQGESAESDFAVVQSDTDLATATSVGLASFPTAGGLVISAGAVSLKDQTGVTAGDYGSANQSATLSVDEHGIITAITESNISIASSAVTGLDSAIDTRIATFGNASTGTGTGTSITFAHGLSSTDLLVQLYDISGSNEELVYADIAINSTNIIVTFGASQTLSNYRIVAMKVT